MSAANATILVLSPAMKAAVVFSVLCALASLTSATPATPSKGRTDTAATSTGSADEVFTVSASRGRFYADNEGGWDLGGGLSLHVDRMPAGHGKSLLDRHAVRLDFNGVGIRVGKKMGANEMDVGFYTQDELTRDDDGGGKDKKGNNAEYLLHALLGFNLTGMIALTMTAFGLLVLKALAVAKFAFVVSAYYMIKKLFGGHGGYSKQMGHQSIELMDMNPSEIHPIYTDYPAGAYSGYPGYGHAAVTAAAAAGAAGGNYLAYSNYAPSAAAQSAASDSSVDTSNVAYAMAEAPTAQALTQSQAVQRRGDIRRKIRKPHYVTVNKFTKLV